MKYVGWAAAILTIATFLPQLYKAARSKRTKDLALSTYLLLVVVSALWTVYGISIHSWQVTITNSVVGIVALMICLLKLRHG